MRALESLGLGLAGFSLLLAAQTPPPKPAPALPLYGITNGRGLSKLGELVTIDETDGKTTLVGAITNHPGFGAPTDLVRSIDGTEFYSTQVETTEEGTKTHLVTIDAKTLKVVGTAPLGEAFDSLVLDNQNRLLATKWEKTGSMLVVVNPKTGQVSDVGSQGPDWQFASLAFDAQNNLLLGLARAQSSKKFFLVRIDPVTGKPDTNVEVTLPEEELPTAMALGSDGKALLTTDKSALWEADPATGKVKRRGAIADIVVVGLHAGK